MRWYGKILKDFWKCRTFFQCRHTTGCWAKCVHVPHDAGQLASMGNRSFLVALCFLIVRVCSHDRQNELIPVWDFKLVWKQVLFMWRFISTAFQNNPIIWWTCAGISFWVLFTWYFITRNEISFLSKWLLWNPYPNWVSNAHAH